MKKKILSILLSLFVVMLMMPGLAAAADTQESKDIVIVYTGDIQGGVLDNITLAGVASYAKEQKQTHSYVEIVDAGNALSGTTLAATSKGQFVVDSMNIAGYGIIAPGENDIAFGKEQLYNLSIGSAFRYVSCNYAEIATVLPYYVKTYGDKRIGYVGITDPIALGIPSDADGALYYQQVQDAIDAARMDGADYIIALGNLSQKSSEIYSAQSTIQNTSGINAFINTGTGTALGGSQIRTSEGKTCLLTSPGADLSSFGVMTISEDKISTLLVNSYQYMDITTKDTIDYLASYYGQALTQSFATTGYKLYAANSSGVRVVESQETNLGDLVADAYKSVTKADVAFVDASEIKSNVEVGPISYNDVLTVVDGNKNISVKRLSGYELLDALEMAVRLYPNRNQHFLQVSGVTFDIQQTVVSTVETDYQGNFILVNGDYRVTNVKVNGLPLDMMKTYTVAGSNNFLSGKTGYSMFGNKQIYSQNVTTDSQAIVDYITNNLKGTIGSLYQKSQVRIDSIKLARQSEIDSEVERLAQEKLADTNSYNASLQQQVKDLQDVIAMKDLKLTASASFKKSGSTRKITVKVKPSQEIEGIGYQYWRSTKKSSGYVKKASKEALSYGNTSVSKGKTYYYKVRAYKYIDGKYYYSDWSNKVSCKVTK